MEKKCYRCKNVKNIKDFYITDKDSKFFRCLKCKEYYDNYYSNHKKQEIDRAMKSIYKNREKTNKYKNKLRKKNPERAIFTQAKTRAAKKGIQFDLEKNDIKIPKFCPILGLELKMNDGCNGPNSPSIDRINPKLGYIKGNIQIISHKANVIKNDASLEELKLIVNFLKIHNKS